MKTDRQIAMTMNTDINKGHNLILGNTDTSDFTFYHQNIKFRKDNRKSENIY